MQELLTANSQRSRRPSRSDYQSSPSKLVKHGKICARAHEGHNADRDDPRTALGYNDRKLFLMVVDGRQGDYSEGMTYRDVANAMIELGATAAINLDGGGSARHDIVFIS